MCIINVFDTLNRCVGMYLPLFDMYNFLYYIYFFQLCNSSSYETVSCETMESIFDGIVETAKCSTLTGLNENSDAHSSEDLSSGQATNGSIKNLLLRGYTKENCKINVIKPNTLN